MGVLHRPDGVGAEPAAAHGPETAVVEAGEVSAPREMFLWIRRALAKGLASEKAAGPGAISDDLESILIRRIPAYLPPPLLNHPPASLLD